MSKALVLRGAGVAVIALMAAGASAQTAAGTAGRVQQPATNAARQGAQGAAQGTQGNAAVAGATRSASSPKLLPGTNPKVLTEIKGNALNTTNGSLPNTVVRLRDARLGQIVDSQLSDKSGLFAFRGVDPGTYIVEVVGNDQTVLAASQMLSVNAGDAVSAVVKLPFRIPPFAGLMSNGAPSATAVTTEAAANGVIAVATTTNTSGAEPATPTAASR